ncbi:hypothetical protein KCV87_28955 [Actinosynnema pretiosum subsp. pretiosum]|uniref:SMODS and SLOG-associating 2TM effector domain-containing protein n=2 Tax=Actinosynnema TaxID=40566 RepID=C6W950_ACTMD|nr:hypothetical protein [Actinosynnema mirum]ACU39122.1 hypothetical protein Amir_5301 [Actinosynnema mirum DSM 43827]AXX32717.1 hypothetical protein APASM_5352 [Actinosynnema pretiosum subsp. pretiosum]QUF03400.1 hypothetical protein KCV87_28955 [Actinosynnema pretiosum subsp. pretiosum]
MSGDGITDRLGGGDQARKKGRPLRGAPTGRLRDEDVPDPTARVALEPQGEPDDATRAVPVDGVRGRHAARAATPGAPDPDEKPARAPRKPAKPRVAKQPNPALLTPPPRRTPLVTGPVSAADHREQFLRAYLRHRVGERLARLEAAKAAYTRARRWTTTASVLLFTGAAALGALAVATPDHRSPLAFLATVAAALATSVTVYESAFGFRAKARRSASGAALLHLLQAHGAPTGDHGVAAFRAEVESVLRHAD